MPKVKTRSAVKKRFAKVGGRKGVKVKRSHAFRRHLLTKKSRKTKRHLRKIGYVNKVNERAILEMLPY